MVFGLSVLHRVYNFKRVCPGPVLDRVWLQDCRRVFGNPKSETLVCIYFSEQCFTSIELLLPISSCVTQELDVVLCPKLGLKIEDIVLHGVGI